MRVNQSGILRFTAAVAIFSTVAVVSLAQQSNDAVYKDLKNSGYWVHPSFNNTLKLDQLKAEVDKSKPYELKVLAIPGLSNKWKKNGAEQRSSFAKYVADKQLKMNDQGVLIVLTRNGISGYNSRLSSAELQQLSNAAAKLVSRTDFTPGVINLSGSIRTAAEVAKSKGQTVAPSGGLVSTPVKKSSGLGGFLCLAIPLGLVGLVVAVIMASKKKAIARSKKAADEKRRQAIDAMSYIDSYDGLLNEGNDTMLVSQYRSRMGEAFDTALVTFKNAKTVQDYDRATFGFQQVLQDFDGAKNSLQAATGGSGVAFTLPPVIDTQRAPVFEPVKGVSYFSSQPSANLVPVEVNFGGSRRTVMVTPEERDEMMAGRMPQMRGQYDGDRFVPWYGVRGYDPYNDYGSSNFMWNMVAFSALSNMFMPSYGFGWGGGLFGGHPYSSWGHPGDHVTINNYGDSYANSGGSDFDFGSDNSGDFNFEQGDNGGGGFDFGGDSGGGGFDFGGGGDFGGGDFGGGDSGGGGDF